jgi:hypothetical protein
MPWPLNLGERAPSMHCIGGWVGPKTSLEDVEMRKILPLTGLDLQPLGHPPLASRYTDCAIPAITAAHAKSLSFMSSFVVA